MTLNETISARPVRFRTIVGMDAATCLVMAVLLLGGGGFLSGLLGIPQVVLTGAGAVLVPVALFMAAIAARSATPSWAAWIVISGNAAWVLASLVLALGPFIEPTALGTAFILAQAAVVAFFAAVEYQAHGRDAKA
jgi:hypothetical protein